MLDITALSELEAQAFCYTRIDIANHLYVTNNILFDFKLQVLRNTETSLFKLGQNKCFSMQL